MESYNKSLKKSDNKDEIISLTRMILGESKESIVAIVEGESDEKFLNNYVHDDVLVKESCGGCRDVDYIIDNLNRIIPKNRRFIGIKDRDYNSISPEINKFYYDYNSLETFLFSIDEVLKKVCNEYYLGEKDKNVLREHIIMELRILSTIRKLNAIYGWELKFSAISIDKLYSADLLQLDSEGVIKSINDSNKSFFDKNPEKLSLIEVELNKEIDYEGLLSITQGHDLINLFHSICNIERSKVGKKKGLQVQDIDSSLRLSCSIADLMETNFYKELKDYESQHGINILAV